MLQKNLEPQKRLSALLIFFFLLVAFRLTALVTAPSNLEKALKPSKKIEVLSPSRGTIFDRNGSVLVTNRPFYEVAICYKDFMAFPAIRAYWEGGRRLKKYPRREKVQKLLALLEKELGLDAQHLEDFVYSQAALVPAQSTPLVRSLSPEQYFRLKSVEDFYPGLRVYQVLRRHYPFGSCAGTLLGCVGPFDSMESILTRQTIASLQAQIAMEEDPLLQEELRLDLEGLYLRLRNMGKVFGKFGIEKQYENLLQGREGKKVERVSASGRILEEIEQYPAQDGKNITLSLDRELQLFAEQLLAENESIRDLLDQPGVDSAALPSAALPWVKGGSIVVMDPHNGEVLALASYPRFNPQSYLYPDPLLEVDPSKHRLFWLETPYAVGRFWQTRWPLLREVYDRSTDRFLWQKKFLSAVELVRALSGPQSNLPELFAKIQSLSKIYALTSSFAALRAALGPEIETWELIEFLYPQGESYWPFSRPLDLKKVEQRWQELVAVLPLESYKRVLEEYTGSLASNFDKMLLIELSALFVDEEAFLGVDPHFIEQQSLDGYRKHLKDFSLVQEKIESWAQEWHEKNAFKDWRRENQRVFLKEKRRQENLEKKPSKPYLQHLEACRAELFKSFWDRFGRDLELSLISDGAWQIELLPLGAFIEKKLEELSFQDPLKRALLDLQELSRKTDPLGLMRYLQGAGEKNFEKLLWANYPIRSLQTRADLRSRFYPRYGLGYMVNKPISYVSAPGSIYKLTMAYEALLQRFQKTPSLYWNDCNPLTLIDQNYISKNQQIVARSLSGREIPQIYRGGRLPKSSRRSIGKIDLLGAIESSSNPYFSLLAQNEFQKPPQDILRVSLEMGWGQKTGIDLPFERAGALPRDLEKNRTGLYTTAIGQHTLLATSIQSAVVLAALANGGAVIKPKMLLFDSPLPERIRQLLMPESIKEYLWEGMRRVVSGKSGTARLSGIRSFPTGTLERKKIQEMVPYMIGKSSTSQFVESLGISSSTEVQKQSNIWFGSIVFEEPISPIEQKPSFRGKRPQIVVVISLYYGSSGKEAFPLAALLAHKWKEICERKKSSKGLTQKA